MRNDKTDNIALWLNRQMVAAGNWSQEFIAWFVGQLGERCVSYDESNIHFITRDGTMAHAYMVHSIWYCKE